MKNQLIKFHHGELELMKKNLASWEDGCSQYPDPEAERMHISSCKEMIQFHEAAIGWLSSLLNDCNVP